MMPITWRKTPKIPATTKKQDFYYIYGLATVLDERFREYSFSTSEFLKNPVDLANMNRRKAIFRISLAGLGIAAAGATWKWWKLVKSPDLDYLRSNRDLVAALCETIIPKTDTPGAKEAGTQDFILKMIRDCTPRKEQNNFISGSGHPGLLPG